MKFRAHKSKVSFLIISLMVVSLAFTSTVSAQTSYYPISQCTLSTSVNYSGAGYVTPSGQNIPYYYGTQVIMRAYTYTGYVFDGWYVNGVYQGKLSTITLTMTQDFTIYAVFSPRSAILTITSNPSDGGTTTPASGMWNSSYGSTVLVTEYSAGNTFNGWYLDGIYQGAGTSISVTMNQDHQLSAFFAGNNTVPTPSPTSTPSPTTTPSPIPNRIVPNLSFYCLTSTTGTGFNVHIQGALAYNQVGISGAGLVFSYSATGGATWHDLTYAITGDDGNFSVVWMPQASGNYLLKASWAGDIYYSNVTTLVALAVTPNPQNQIFSVSSNSSLSSLIFNSETSQLAFSVTGPSGTDGYVEACIPKSLLPTYSTLVVTLDGTTNLFTAISQGDTWLINIMYHHSSHSIVMALNNPTPTQSTNTPTNPPTNPPSNPTSNPTNPPSNSTPTPVTPELTPIVILPLIVVMLGLAIFVAFKRRSKPTATQE